MNHMNTYDSIPQFHGMLPFINGKHCVERYNRTFTDLNEQRGIINPDTFGTATNGQNFISDFLLVDSNCFRSVGAIKSLGKQFWKKVSSLDQLLDSTLFGLVNSPRYNVPDSIYCFRGILFKKIMSHYSVYF